MKKIKEEKIYRLCEFTAAITICVILAALVIIDNRFSYVYQTFCRVPNLVVAGTFFVLLAAYLILRKQKILFGRKRGSEKKAEATNLVRLEAKLERRNFILLALILLVLQLLAAWQIYFKTGWDCGTLVQMAQKVAFGYEDIGSDPYFSMYPNNVLLVAIFAFVLRITRFLGAEGADYFPLVAMGCLLVNFAGFFMEDIIRKLTKKQWIAMTAWVAFIILAGLSPWISIPYSDTYSILFPVLCVWLYMQKTARNQYVIYGAIVFCGMIGSYIKPTVLLVLIALGLVEGWRFFQTIRREKAAKTIGRAALVLAVAILAAGCAAGIDQVAKYKMGCELEEEKAFTPVHYLMMGLNYKTGGTYDQWDVNLSAATQTKEERNARDFEEIKARISQMGPKGLVRHYTRKLLTNFNDGIFAWGNEGEFYWNIPEKNNWLAVALRSFYYESGAYYSLFQVIGQGAWILALCCMTGLVKKEKEQTTPLTALITLSVFAVICFVMLFEARARYLFLYVPLFIICAALGLERLVAERETAEKEIIDKSTAI